MNNGYSTGSERGQKRSGWGDSGSQAAAACHTGSTKGNMWNSCRATKQGAKEPGSNRSYSRWVTVSGKGAGTPPTASMQEPPKTPGRRPATGKQRWVCLCLSGAAWATVDWCWG
jgi:hypothetical protein